MQAMPANNRAQLILQLKKSPTQANPITAQADDRPAPLSFAQERLWVMSRMEPDNPLYNVAGALQFDGILNIAALRQALGEVVRRHHILLTCFVTEHHEAVQKVMTGHSLALCQVDLTAAPTYRADEFIRKPFDLTGELPIRALLIHLGNQRHQLRVALHHIVSDRWSVGLLMKEVFALYICYCDGKPSTLPELAIQYRDFAIWQRQQQDKWAQNLAYWQNKLQGIPPLLELPTDYPRPPVQSHRGSGYAFSLSAARMTAIKQLAKDHQASLFMVISTALNILLYRYTGSRDIAIGYPCAGREQLQTTNLIGFFVNTLILRCRLHDDVPFSYLLGQIREQALQDQAHQMLALGHLLETLNLARNPSHTPLFQVMLTVQNAPASHCQLPALDITPVAIGTDTAQFDLTLLVEEQDGLLAATFEYNTDLFAADTIARMAGHLDILLASISRNPNLAIKHLAWLGEAETEQLLYGWNPPCLTLAISDDKPVLLVHQLVSVHAQSAPDKIALAFAGQNLSYAELEHRATHLANRLSRLGIGPESRVGVCAKRSVELVVALLAVLKAGAAYVPLDPDYPHERLAYMAHDAGLACLLTQQTLGDRFIGQQIPTLYLDASAVAATDSPELPVSHCQAHLDNTAYIIYTSGSTGQPKGVLVSHRNLLHSTYARSRYYRDPPTCFLLLSSFAFDSSVAGIFWTLSQGGRLCLPQPEELNQAFALAQLIQRQQVSHLLALPSFYAAITNDHALPLLASLKTVIVAGEACPVEIAADHHRHLPTVKLFNEYGPTEATVWSSVWQSRHSYNGATLPIGRPIDGVQIYILDKHYQPVPIGISGELTIGGTGLARGYLGQAGLTADKFIPHPFAADGQRLYRTGDLGRYRNDGSIEFLGRSDNQVKIRGYRIELGEIESRLLQYPGITAAVVLARQDKPGNTRLLAYLVTGPAVEADSQALERHLKQTLPDYMLPSAFITLDSLPLTPNGKLDRNALPDQSHKTSSAPQAKLPANATEITLATIWQDVLGIEITDTGSNFFELGGHSLAAIQVISRIQDVFGVELPIDRLFEAATIELLALEITASPQHENNALDTLLHELEQMSEQEAQTLLDA